MVFGGHHHVFHTGSACESSPIPGRVRLWVELICKGFIFLDRNSLVFHHPLVPLQHAVKAPVNKHSKLCLMPPLHSPCAICDCRRSWCAIIDRRRLSLRGRQSTNFGQSQFSRSGSDQTKVLSSA